MKRPSKKEIQEAVERLKPKSVAPHAADAAQSGKKPEGPKRQARIRKKSV